LSADGAGSATPWGANSSQSERDDAPY
jgi:hypothetical protein